MQSVNPFTGEVVAEYQEYRWEDVDGRLIAAHNAFLDWRRSPFSERSAVLRSAAKRLEARKDELARLMAIEMGKPVTAGRAEVEKCAWVCNFYADEAESMLADVVIPTERTKSYLHHEPLGPVLAVMPWNFPFWQVFRFLAPALMAGNAGLLKHSSNVSGCALAIEEVMNESGIPDGLFSTLLIGSSMVDRVIEHPAVVAATLTGSDPAGRAVAAKAGAVLKKTVLELGGSDPYLVMADADVAAAAATCATSRLINSGQSCICAKRFIVVEEVVEEFTRMFVENMASTTMGDPMLESTKLGPMARHDLRDELHKQVMRTIDAGGKASPGGRGPGRSRRLLSTDGAGRRRKGHGRVSRGNLRTGRGDHHRCRRGRSDTSGQ